MLFSTAFFPKARCHLFYGFTQIREVALSLRALGSATDSPRSSAVAKVQPDRVGRTLMLKVFEALTAMWPTLQLITLPLATLPSRTHAGGAETKVNVDGNTRLTTTLRASSSPML